MLRLMSSQIPLPDIRSSTTLRETKTYYIYYA